MRLARRSPPARAVEKNSRDRVFINRLMERNLADDRLATARIRLAPRPCGTWRKLRLAAGPADR